MKTKTQTLGFELQVVPLELKCSLCHRPYPVTLRLPADAETFRQPSFTCRHCTRTDRRYHAPEGMPMQAWIKLVAAAGWQCAGCGCALDFDSLRNFAGKPVCERCRGRAYRTGNIVSSGLDRDAA